MNRLRRFAKAAKVESGRLVGSQAGKYDRHSHACGRHAHAAGLQADALAR